MTINFKSIIVNIAFICCMLSDLFNISFFGYSDEILGVICCLGIIFELAISGEKKINKLNDIIKIISLFIVSVFIGFISNYYSGINITHTLMFLEAFIYVKQYMIFVFLLMFFSDKSSKKSLNVICKISQIMIVILAITAIKNLFLDRLSTFRFLAHFGGTVAAWVILFLGIIFYCDLKEKFIYYILGAFIVIYSNSGAGILGLGIIIAIYLVAIKGRKIKFSYIIIFIPILIIISYDEIAMYLLDSTAPRALLFIYSFVTASRFFPFGAGFATYGSASAAAIQYSELYYEYGFNTRYGMSEDNPLFLMDSYYPRIIGETGYIGFLLFIVYTYCLIKKFIVTIPNKNKLWYTVALVIYIYISGLGFGTGGAWGCAVYIVIAEFIFVGNLKQDEKTDKEGKKY